MNQQKLIHDLDDMVFKETGKHLDSLQLKILKGVLEGKKYQTIADDYNCSNGHVKDKAYELWQILSQALNEDVNKSNFESTIERLGFKNISSSIVGNMGNKVKIENISFCGNSQEKEEIEDQKEHNNNEELELNFKLKMIPKLMESGFNKEQIASLLEFPVEKIQNIDDQRSKI